MIIWPVVRIESEKRRLVVLQYLSKQPGYHAAADLLRAECNRIGVPTTTDQMNGCIQWLEEQELSSVRHVADNAIARITARGREVAEGSAIHPGVQRPDP